jgi:hypothetical protein
MVQQSSENILKRRRAAISLSTGSFLLHISLEPSAKARGVSQLSEFFD